MSDLTFNDDVKILQIFLERPEVASVGHAGEPAWGAMLALKRIVAIAEERRVAQPPPGPIPMRLPCERCGALHIDKGRFATHPHHTHTCQHCGLTWRPAKEHTVGVQWIPGFKDAEGPEAEGGATWGMRGTRDFADAVNRSKPLLKAIHIGSKWRHVTDAVNDFTVTLIDRLIRCTSDGPSWEGSESEFRKQFLWVSDP